MFVVPDGFWTRDQNSSRNLSPAEPVSVKTPNAFRSLLFGGIEPVTMVGLAISSDVPWPKASSLAPVLGSLFAETPVLRPLPVPPASQSIQGLAPSTFRFASVSISKSLPERTLAVVHVAVAVPAAPCGGAAADTVKTATTTAAASSVAILGKGILFMLPFLFRWLCQARGLRDGRPRACPSGTRRLRRPAITSPPATPRCCSSCR